MRRKEFWSTGSVGKIDRRDIRDDREQHRRRAPKTRVLSNIAALTVLLFHAAIETHGRLIYYPPNKR